ncbi:MAG TPA: nucleoside monophosphate kinase [Bryobacteraceae bacterium]|nr:nucleoside monophosphate kinase [Bryobacteraceae bacterium]
MNNGGPRKALILFGSPGSGKGTQAKLLKSCWSAPHVSTGDMLRAHIEAGDELGLEVRAVMQAGMLVPDDLVNRLVEKRLLQDDTQAGVVLDGYPRTLQQAETLGETLGRHGLAPVVIHLKVDYNEIISRLSGRRQCPLCGTLYNLTTNPPKVNGICDKDGTLLVTRPDDSEAVIRQRLEEYDHQTRPLLEYFRRAGVPFYEVDGIDDGPQAISTRICRLVTQGG